MELCSVLCGSLDGRGVWRRMGRCICMTDSLYHPPKTITFYNVFWKKKWASPSSQAPQTSSPCFLFICSWFILELSSMSAPFHFLYLPLPHPLTTTHLQGYYHRFWSLASLIQLKKPCQSDLLKHCSDHLTSLSLKTSTSPDSLSPHTKTTS